MNITPSVPVIVMDYKPTVVPGSEITYISVTTQLEFKVRLDENNRMD